VAVRKDLNPKTDAENAVETPPGDTRCMERPAGDVPRFAAAKRAWHIGPGCQLNLPPLPANMSMWTFSLSHVRRFGGSFERKSRQHFH